MKIMFLGAPGAGKGTQAEHTSERLGIPAISTGAIIREAIKNETAMGLAAKAYTEKGALVPDEVVIGIIKERLDMEDCKNGYILDGFPRTVVQAEALDEMGIEMDAVISIEVADEAIIARMGGRRVCPVCSATYHVDFKPSKDGEHCDNDGAVLTLRRDDSPEVVADRLRIYHEQTEPLKDYYSARGKLVLVNGEDTIENITAEIEKKLEAVKG